MKILTAHSITMEEKMMMHPLTHPVLALVAGILILIFPAILNYIVAIYLIVIGVMGIVGSL